MRSLTRSIPTRQDAERRLFLAYHEGDEAAREALIEQYLPFAKRLARRYGRSSEPIDDLQQVAMIGLLNAIDRFDVEQGTAFASFALPTILGEIRRYFRDYGWSLHVPRGVQERALKVQQAQERLTTALHTPTVRQLAEYLELDHEQVLEALLAVEAYDTLSIDSPSTGSSRDDSAWVSLAHKIGEDDARFELIELHATLVRAFERLEAREREILRLRFARDFSQSEIAARIGVSQMQVSRLLRRALQKLRESPTLAAWER